MSPVAPRASVQSDVRARRGPTGERPWSAFVGWGGGVSHPGESSWPPVGPRRGAAELEMILAQQPRAGDAPGVGWIAVEEGDDAVDERLDRSPGRRIQSGIQVGE